METLISMNQVSKSFGSVQAVDDVNVSVQKGEILGFLGPNASGKTTTVRLLNGVIFPEIRKISGVLTETAALYEHMTAKENLQFFARLYGIPDDVARKRINELLERFSLLDRQKQKVATFSTGLKKRLGIAKALVHKPEILYLDEPTSGLDPESSQDLIGYIKELNSEQMTVFVCTHNLSEAEHFCTRFVFLDKGRVIEGGTLAELEEKYEGIVVLRIDYRGEIADLPAEISVNHLLGDFSYRSAHLTIPTKKQIPEIIRTLAEKVDIYRAEQVNSGLESLYFEIRRQLK
jgi:ABC-2 type transport system ATP-binding protein